MSASTAARTPSAALTLTLPATRTDTSTPSRVKARAVPPPHGTIVYAEVNPDYTRRPEPQDMLAVL
ncbi:hypothetical protein [Janthinobacterium agaricidamnosum]|uniref:Uncharacterized protein n=1 Tax=Janthinobacterium agaricidamnosum NBRC 102515 = DSM 9628 TaxID=1349767 RepID=W0V5Z8_9BURK|nr:hypothetical protein GJA_2057 [Janthinobacterium agaricidamnosum NBRC 102515 = DSM 9628]